MPELEYHSIDDAKNEEYERESTQKIINAIRYGPAREELLKTMKLVNKDVREYKRKKTKRDSETDSQPQKDVEGKVPSKTQ